MQKKILIAASVISMIEWFIRDDLNYLKVNCNCEVHLATNFDYLEDTNENNTKLYIDELKEKGVILHNIHFSRMPVNLDNIVAFTELKCVIRENEFDVVHCHTPVVGAMIRILCVNERKKGTKVIYTAHGFHFYSGAPLKNWLVYYSVEWLCSFMTDILVTINHEDYIRAKKRMHAKETLHMHGIGVNLEKFARGNCNISQKREKLGVTPEELMLLSVGELSVRKNHGIVIKALARCKTKNIKYYICGKGALENRLRILAKDYKVEDRVIFLGYRTDISELCQAADLFVFPSLQEGLPVALMEAIACKTPVVCTCIRGNTDLVSNCDMMFNSDDDTKLANIVDNLGNLNIGVMVEDNYKNLQKFGVNCVSKEKIKMYKRVGIFSTI